MSTRRQTDRNVKPQNLGVQKASEVVSDQLKALARQGAQELLMAALNEEVDAYLGRDRNHREDAFCGQSNGSSSRRLTLGSDTIDETLMKLFIESLAPRDFEPALRLLVGAQAPLSASVISRLTQRFKARYEAFDRQELGRRQYVYIWAGGIYLKAGLGTEKACLLVLIGADREGKKHLLALREGYRESAASWGDLLRDCRQRGMNEPACWIADGAPGIWAAVNDHCPHSAQQRCTNHKTMNVVDKLPLRERPAYLLRLRAIWQADRREEARHLAADVVRDLREAGYDRSADCLEDDLDRCLTFYDFREAHWSYLRTTNVIESPFASVRLRTNAARRFKKTKSGVYLVHEVMQRMQQKWLRLKSAHLCAAVPLPEKEKQSKVA